ncbi:MAG: hypothetical protein OSA99_05980 [Acidimicrobiales bacterium]|nr:hypothetical protein [Acidimicrobiales bacterium]
MIRRIVRSPITAGIALAGGVTLAGFGIADAVGGNDSGLSADPDEVSLVEDFAAAVTTFDAGRIDADIDRILSLGTADFETEFRNEMGETFVADLQASGSSSSGEIVAGPTIQRIDDGVAVFFVVVNQQISAPAAAESDAGEESPTTAAAPQSRVVRVGLLVQVDQDEDLVSSVQVL